MNDESMGFDSTRFPMTDPVVKTACECIQELMEHLSWKDNPPVNWKKNHVDTALEEKKAFSNVRRPLSTDGNIHKSGMAAVRGDRVETRSPRYTSDMIAHTSLIALSKWTLEAVGSRSALERKEECSENKQPLEKDDEDIPTASLSSRQWRSIFSRTKVVSERNSNRKSIAANAKDGDRMHQFGSEYAKHLFDAASLRGKMQQKTFHRRRMSLARRTRNETTEGIIHNIEDADHATRTGALVDMCVTLGNDPPPTGFFRVSQSASGHPFFVANGVNDSRKMYLNIKKEPNWDRAAQRPCITTMCLVFPDRKEFVPPGFSAVCHANSTTPADFGMKKEGHERIMLCFRLSREGNPLTGIVPLIPHFGEEVPSGYTVVERSPRNHTACFSTLIPDVTSAQASQTDKRDVQNTKVAIFFAYRQRLENLESLRPYPLLSAVRQNESKADGEVPTLESYYCSGGSVVSSSVGRFHILDRSTHTLVGPTSVENRLKLIEASRQKSSETEHDIISGIYLGSSFGPCSRSDDSSYAARSITSKRHSRDGWDEYSLSTKHSTAVIDSGSVASSKRSTSRTTRNRASQHLFTMREIGEPVVSAMDCVPHLDVATGLGDEGVDAFARLPIRTALLAPILSACYTRHGRVALVAVEILTKLLTHTAMFKDDVEVSDERDGESCSRLTLLDLSVQSVCDVATGGAEETFSSCVEFVELAVQFSQGQLSTRTIGFVVRFYLFVFSFGSSAGRECSAQWQASSTIYEQGLCKDDDVPLLLDMRKDGSRQSRLPGGAPQAAALALKDLIYFSMVRLGKVSFAELLVSNELTDEDLDNFYGHPGDTPPSTLVKGAVSNVDRANYTQVALHQVRRSGGSEMFWHDMVAMCGQKLFRKDTPDCCDKDTFVLIFAMLTNVIKVSSGKLRPRTGKGLPRDLRCKLLSLELLLHFLECWSDEQEAVVGVARETMGVTTSHNTDMLAFSVRRMVAPCLLWNTQPAFENHLVYRRVLRIISEIWSSPMHRKRCKVEIGILVEHFAVRLLEVGPHFIEVNEVKNLGLYPQQSEVMKEMTKWFFQHPNDVLEFFLNYDTDFSVELAGSGKRLPSRRRKLFQRISAGLCRIAEMSSEVIGKPLQKDRSLADRMSCQKGDMINNALIIERTAKSKNEKTESAIILRNLSLGTTLQIVKSLALSAAFSLGASFSDLLHSWVKDGNFSIIHPHTHSVLSDESDSSLSEEDGERTWKSIYTGASGRTVKLLDEVIQIAKDENIKKAIEYAIARNVITSCPRDVAYFLQSNREELDAADLGNYISEEGVGGANDEHQKAVRYLFVRALSFVGLNVDQALRQFLTASGFLLPGEAQKIDRLLQTFARCFYEDNAGDFQYCPFETEDPVYVLCFAIIMLNTDLHNKVCHRNQPGARKMTKAEFIANTRNAHSSLKVDDGYLATIYESIENCPIILEKVHLQEYGESFSVDVWIKYARAADSELRSLAVSNFSFGTVEEYGVNYDFSRMGALQDLARRCACETWQHWYGVINTTLETALLDKTSVLPSLHILLYAIAISICLDLSLVRSAFLGQLWKFAVLSEGNDSDSLAENDHVYHKYAWFTEIENYSVGSDESKRAALENIHSRICSLLVSLTDDGNSRATMESASQEIESGTFSVEDPSRSFLRSGDLHKRSPRTGRSSQCRLYLFSDVLLYCNAKRNGQYRIHEELPLHLLKVIDWFPPSDDLRNVLFEVHHPRKTFQVLCSGVDEKKSWVTAIKAAVRREVERKSRTEAARLSLLTRLHDDNDSVTSR